MSPGQRARLAQVSRTGAAPAATQVHARILLKADTADGRPTWRDTARAAALDVSVATGERGGTHCVTAGLEAAPQRTPTTRPSQRKLDGAQDAHLAARACAAPPAGAARWTLARLADTLVELRVVGSLARDTVRVALKKTHASRG